MWLAVFQKARSKKRKEIHPRGRLDRGGRRGTEPPSRFSVGKAEGPSFLPAAKGGLREGRSPLRVL